MPPKCHFPLCVVSHHPFFLLFVASLGCFLWTSGDWREEGQDLNGTENQGEDEMSGKTRFTFFFFFKSGSLRYNLGSVKSPILKSTGLWVLANVYILALLKPQLRSGFETVSSTAPPSSPFYCDSFLPPPAPQSFWQPLICSFTLKEFCLC